MDSITSLRASGAITTEGGSPFASACLICTTDNSINSNVFTLPYIASSSAKDTTEVKSKDDEGGSEHTIAGGKRSANWELTFMQNDKATKELYNTLRDKVISVVKEEHTVQINGKYQYRIAPYCKIVSDFDNSKPSIETKFTLKPERSPANITLNLTCFDDDFATTLTCASLVIPAGTYYYLYEQ